MATFVVGAVTVVLSQWLCVRGQKRIVHKWCSDSRLLFFFPFNSFYHIHIRMSSSYDFTTTKPSSTSQTHHQLTTAEKVQVIESITPEQSLLIEFPDFESSSVPTTPFTDPSAPVSSRMKMIFDSHSEDENSSMSSPSDLDTSPDPVAMHTPLYTHLNLPERDASTDLIAPITSGLNLFAYFGTQTVPRSRYNIMVSATNEQGNSATATIPSNLTVTQICDQYPSFVTGTFLRVCNAEGFNARVLWSILPQNCRPDHWHELAADMAAQVALAAEFDTTHSADTDTAAPIDETNSPTADDDVPRNVAPRRTKAPRWTDEDDTTLYKLKAEGRSSVQIGQALNRTPIGVRSRLHLLKTKKIKADAKAAEEAAGDQTSDDDGMVVDLDSGAVGGQVEGEGGVVADANGIVEDDTAMAVDTDESPDSSSPVSVVVTPPSPKIKINLLVKAPAVDQSDDEMVLD